MLNAARTIDELHKNMTERFKSGGEVEHKVPVIETSLTFESFFHPNKFIRITESLFQGQREFVQLRLHADNKWYVYIKHVMLSTIELSSQRFLTDKDWKYAITNEEFCRNFIHYIKLAESKGEFKFEPLCDKCKNTKVITQTWVTPGVYNGFKVNIHEQQEIACTCNC